MPLGRCLLCDTHGELQHSHVVPAFAYRWLRESSGTGHIRTNQEPNRRTQDGPKHYWLCASCEERFSRSETAFTGRLFHPYLENSGRVFPYSEWLCYFCGSVSWRVLRHFLQDQPLDEWKNCSPEEREHVLQAELAWREFLLGKRQNPGRHQQHMLPVNQVSESRGDFSPNLNRYLMRAVHMDVCMSGRSSFTYAKLGRFLILGFIDEPNPTRWKGTKVHARQGLLQPRNYEVPAALGHYINEKATQIREAMSTISGRQKAKIDSTLRANVERLVSSDAFSALQADVELFGDAACARNESPEKG